MKGILIDPWQHSVERIDLKNGYDAEASKQLHQLVGEEALGWAHIMEGETIAVGDRSALANPPLASYMIESYPHRLFGRGVLMGYDRGGKDRDTTLSVEDVFNMITWC